MGIVLKTRVRVSLIALSLFALSLLVAPAVLIGVGATPAQAENKLDAQGASPLPSLEEVKAAGARASAYRNWQPRGDAAAAPQANIESFRQHIAPILNEACTDCHGADTQEANLRVDALDPDLFQGGDVHWWLEVLAVLNNGEMPPADGGDLADEDRSRVVEWLSSEIQLASAARRSEQPHSSFRRMTRYEYNYALQDLLGLPWNFAKDLPPEPTSEDGFQNSSEMLHMSSMQFGTYRELSLRALRLATVRGERPAPMYWSIPMQQASADAWAAQEKQLEKIRQQHKDEPEKQAAEVEKQAAKFRGNPRHVHYKMKSTGQVSRVNWSYNGARHAWTSSETLPAVPEVSDQIVVIPPRRKMVVELGNQLAERGTLRIRVRASRAEMESEHIPSLQIEFGWQASNDSSASVKISTHDVPVTASPDAPEIYEWNFPISQLFPRNLMRKTGTMGQTPSPSEYVKLVNSAASKGDIQIDYVEISAPVYEHWPPASHKRIFIDSANKADEEAYASQVLANFMRRAWRREVSDQELAQKMKLWRQIRPACEDGQQAVVEVLATVLSSPKFLYLVQIDPQQPQPRLLSPTELATRLSMFLWCSTPDAELMQLAEEGQLAEPDVLAEQVDRLLADPRSSRFSENFVRQWLGLALLDYLDVDRKAYPRFDAALKEAMQQEPIALFQEMLRGNHSVVDFLHCDYTIANERLAKHYGLVDVRGNHFRRVKLDAKHARGGLLTQAGLLAMNSDGKDSHPLKRSVWLLERLLNDPPPPPPPAVPEIDLTDPEIAKMTLKQRIEDHRNQAACMSCHAKIDPWGIAFENFDAVGSWRTKIKGKPVDASSQLFNGQELNGMDGLKRFLLRQRQDQFVRAMTHKMTTYALGRPLAFGDRSSVDQVTADIRAQGDGLATMVKRIVTSELFQSK